MIKRPKVLLVEDHAMVAQGLNALLRHRFEVVGIVPDGDGVLPALRETRPHVLLLDLSIPKRNGLDLIPDVRRKFPRTRILVLTMHAEPTLVRMALAEGALGYVLKDADLEELQTAIHTVLGGHRYVTPRVDRPRRGALPRGPTREAYFKLSPRQQQILRAIGEGKSSAEIAKRLKVSLHTVRFHRHRIRQVLGIGSTDGLTRSSVIMWLDES